MFETSAPLWQIVARTVVVYGLIVIGLKLIGKKEMGQMTVPDLVLVLLIANAVQNAMVGSDSSLQGGLLSAAVLLVLNRAVDTLTTKNARLEALLEGTPTLLVHDGEIILDHCQRECVTRAQIEMAMREHGIDDLSQVKTAVLEIDGSISIIPAGETTLRSKSKVKRIRRRPTD